MNAELCILRARADEKEIQNKLLVLIKIKKLRGAKNFFSTVTKYVPILAMDVWAL